MKFIILFKNRKKSVCKKLESFDWNLIIKKICDNQYREKQKSFFF